MRWFSLNQRLDGINRDIGCEYEKTYADEFKSKLLASFPCLVRLQSPQQARTGKTFNNRIHAETNERDAASYDTRTDTNNCFGEIPAKREILKATTFARVAFAQINVCRNRR